MTNTILERISEWKLRRRLPFYVQLSNAHQEDLNALTPQTILVSLREMVRMFVDSIQWRHPVKRTARQDFIRAFIGEREKLTDHEKAFYGWCQQCWRATNFMSGTPLPPRMILFPSVVRALDEATDKFLAEKVLSSDALAWFENSIPAKAEIIANDVHFEPTENCNQQITLYEIERFWDEEYDEACLAELEELSSQQPTYEEREEAAWAEIRERDNQDYYTYDTDDFGMDDYEAQANIFGDDFGNE